MLAMGTVITCGSKALLLLIWVRNFGWRKSSCNLGSSRDKIVSYTQVLCGPAFPHSWMAVVDKGIRFSSGLTCVLLQPITTVQWEVGSDAIGSSGQRLPIRTCLSGSLHLIGLAAITLLVNTPVVLLPAWDLGDSGCSLEVHGARIQRLVFEGITRVIHYRHRVRENKGLMMNSFHVLK